MALILSTTSIRKKMNLNDVKLGMKSYMHYHDQEDAQGSPKNVVN